MKAVHFGAGNIGLGFIGLLLSRAGYEVQFVDIDAERVALLNERGEYRVTLADENAETTVVSGVSAIDGRDAKRVARAVADADLVTTAVGPNVLRLIAENIARGIELRLAEGSGGNAAAVGREPVALGGGGKPAIGAAGKSEVGAAGEPAADVEVNPAAGCMAGNDATPVAAATEGRAADSARPLVVIACENAIGASTMLREHVYGHLSPDAQIGAGDSVFFPNAAVDRIVPLQQHEDKLQVTVEPFYEWVIDRSALPKGYPELAGVHYVDRLEPYIERKLFTVNTGHCCAAYHGYLKGYGTIQEAMRDESVADRVRGAMSETGAALVRQHGFDEAEHRRYIDKILERFRNPHLTDEVVRVGRSPLRKLAPNDRLVRPARLAHELGLGTAHLTDAIAAALRFDYAEDAEAVELQRSIREQGMSETLVRYTGLAADYPLHAAIVAAYRELGAPIRAAGEDRGTEPSAYTEVANRGPGAEPAHDAGEDRETEPPERNAGVNRGPGTGPAHAAGEALKPGSTQEGGGSR